MSSSVNMLLYRFITRWEKNCSRVLQWQWFFTSFQLWPLVILFSALWKKTDQGVAVIPFTILKTSSKSALFQRSSSSSSSTSSSRMRVINHNWSATKQRPHPQSRAYSRDKPPFSFVRGQDSTIPTDEVSLRYGKTLRCGNRRVNRCWTFSNSDLSLPTVFNDSFAEKNVGVDQFWLDSYSVLMDVLLFFSSVVYLKNVLKLTVDNPCITLNTSMRSALIRRSSRNHSPSFFNLTSYGNSLIERIIF